MMSHLAMEGLDDADNALTVQVDPWVNACLAPEDQIGPVKTDDAALEDARTKMNILFVFSVIFVSCWFLSLIVYCPAYCIAAGYCKRPQRRAAPS